MKYYLVYPANGRGLPQYVVGVKSESFGTNVLLKDAELFDSYNEAYEAATICRKIAGESPVIEKVDIS